LRGSEGLESRLGGKIEVLKRKWAHVGGEGRAWVGGRGPWGVVRGWKKSREGKLRCI
jgi:hypothetical protein